jgi:site-specific DNA-methyltransferase (adenine-specific)/modification methylase
MRVEKIGGQTLILGDCLEIMPTLDKVDAVVTDPPYGIDYKASQPNSTEYKRIANDKVLIDLRRILLFADFCIAFGANNFPEQLPHRGRWLCWDKRTIDGAADKMMGSPFELAWANKSSGYDKIVRVLHGGVVNADGGKRVHPTQKPIQVMIEAIRWAAKDAQTILDPFMGSGTTLVACQRLGRNGIGIELDPDYFEIACKRVDEATRQPDMFIAEPAPKPTQTGFDL